MMNVEGSWMVHIRFVRGDATHSMQVEQDGEECRGDATARSMVSARWRAALRGSDKAARSHALSGRGDYLWI